MSKIKFIVGIDEVGRGPIAGPVSVCSLCVPIKSVDKVLPRGLLNSKALSEKKREEWFRVFHTYLKEGLINYKVASVSNTVIDARGITFALRLALSRSLSRLNLDPKETQILLDGSLYAPSSFLYQKTIVRGDEKESIIAAASIMAKVTRDRKMKRLSCRYPEYRFDQHKGYGTKKHRELALENGLSEIHRKTFTRHFAD